MIVKFVAIVTALALTSVTWAGSSECAESPGSVIKLCVNVQQGRATFEVSRLGRPVLEPSNLGLEFAGEPEPHYDAIASTERKSYEGSWEQPWGEQRVIQDRHSEMSLVLKGSTPFTAQVVVTFRLFDDGIGFRYRFPDIPAGRAVEVSAERTSFQTTGAYEAWWYQALGQERDEYLYTHTEACWRRAGTWDGKGTGPSTATSSASPGPILTSTWTRSLPTGGGSA